MTNEIGNADMTRNIRHFPVEARVIKTQDHYEAALNELEKLVRDDPELGTAAADRLELLTVLVQDFESRSYKVDDIDPVDAIEFRMAEQGLKQKDLVPLLGSRSRVSEVLGRKRSLTLQMIRALHAGLGIPLAVLVENDVRRLSERPDDGWTDDKYEWSDFPIAEMRRRGWFRDLPVQADSAPEELVKCFLAQVTERVNAVPALFRRTFRGQGASASARYSLIAWTARVLIRAKEREMVLPNLEVGRLDTTVFREVALLSALRDGPRLLASLLENYGVILVIEPALAGTLVDGAALLTESGKAVIALTLRHDRIDNFWFTVLHELVHVRDHLTTATEAFVDRIDDEAHNDPSEQHANRVARDTLVPRAHWRSSEASVSPSKSSIIRLAREIGVHPAIIAGRVQFETGQFDRFGELLGKGEVRHLFHSVPKR